MGDERIRIERLGHVQVGAHLRAALAIELLALGSEQHDVNVAQAQLVLDRIAHVEAILLGHHHVKKNQVGLFFEDGFKRLFAIGRCKNIYAFVFELFQGLLDQGAQMWFVVDNEDFHRGH